MIRRGRLQTRDERRGVCRLGTEGARRAGDPLAQRRGHHRVLDVVAGGAGDVAPGYFQAGVCLKLDAGCDGGGGY